MGKNLNYFDMAENDYQYIKEDIKQNRIGNPTCYIAQSICERYLKHVIDITHSDKDSLDALRTHSLKKIMKYIKSNIPDFIIEWSAVLKADGYYFSARYPGDDSFMIDEDDALECFEAVTTTRTAVISYANIIAKTNKESMKSNPNIVSDINMD